MSSQFSVRSSELRYSPSDVPTTPNFELRTENFFVTFEGGEGAGKSTQARALAERFRAVGRVVTLTREPGGTRYGEAARSLVLQRTLHGAGAPLRIDDTAELLLFASDRAQHVDELIRPALERGEVVICDRFTDSTLAYQGYGRGIDRDTIRQVNRIATGGLVPNLTVLLDLPVAVGLARRLGERAPDAIEREAADFHERVRAGFLALAEVEPQRWLVVDGTLPPDAISRRVWERAEGLATAQPTRRE